VVKELIGQGAPFGAEGENQQTPLYRAVFYGHLEVVRALLEAYPSEKQKPTLTKQGLSPLFAASQRGHAEVVKELIEQGAPFRAEGKNHDTPLYTAAFKGHLEVVKTLLETYPSEKQNPTLNRLGLSPLFVAARYGQNLVVQELFEKGAPFQREGEEQETPLFVAARNNHLRVVQYFAPLLKDECRALSRDGKTIREVSHGTIKKYLEELGYCKGRDFLPKESDYPKFHPDKNFSHKRG
jgi:ankyrin repeat protein